MNHHDFEYEVVRDQFEKSLKVLSAKADEYSQDDDRFWNFYRAACILDVTPERALLGMKVKHDVSIMDIVDLCETWERIAPGDKESMKATIDEKFTDSINYLLLLKGMLLERFGLMPADEEVDTEPDDRIVML